ncbi:type II toxin-antitoxin system prevent-host-death family antitoxin [Acidithiobacillus ferrooxidans]|uniref:type II toxin-antitoxin system Phd/YefM family antitoxin n=1 Tax=Acidithiobacillus ferrooxidans TaxID=920 RepID=UPI0021491262|nr:type II toxin-antitoxin system prevent-host-death family antitoxin [Acidithiobacillus ferrooxidans]MCR1347294.1 type II toxin-antitoxin system prevent-host-death family antitoxin [Acidithiobacillus ferrooxidans]MCR1354845.1 type II toxin-antitoxin system prevent-host-death family antitoxin [Acidithiobacillus ferrooxidans]
MHVVSYSEARDNLKGVIDRAVEDADVTIITRRGSSNAVLLSQDLFDSLMETVHLLRSPANAAHLAQSIVQDQAGQTSSGGLSDA